MVAAVVPAVVCAPGGRRAASAARGPARIRCWISVLPPAGRARCARSGHGPRGPCGSRARADQLDDLGAPPRACCSRPLRDQVGRGRPRRAATSASAFSSRPRCTSRSDPGGLDLVEGSGSPVHHVVDGVQCTITSPGSLVVRRPSRPEQRRGRPPGSSCAQCDPSRSLGPRRRGGAAATPDARGSSSARAASSFACICGIADAGRGQLCRGCGPGGARPSAEPACAAAAVRWPGAVRRWSLSRSPLARGMLLLRPGACGGRGRRPRPRGQRRQPTRQAAADGAGATAGRRVTGEGTDHRSACSCRGSRTARP